MDIPVETLSGRKPEEPMVDEPLDIAEVCMPVPEPDEDDPRTLVNSYDEEDFYEASDCD